MDPRFRPSETVPRSIRRVIRQQIDRALAEMDDAKLDPHEAIHEVRKRFKKIRAALRLVRSELGGYYALENAWYRDQGRELSSVRDATTLIEALDALSARFPERIDETPAEPVRRWLVKRRQAIIDETGDAREALRALREPLRQARARIALWPLRRAGFEALASGLDRTYAQGRKALRRAAQEPTAERLHELRKRVKDHWYHSRLLAAIWPRRMQAYRRMLGNLAELLGDDHDLSLLRQVLADSTDLPVKSERLAPLSALLEKRQTELRAEAMTKARRIYAESPKALQKRLETYWREMKEEA